MRPSLAIAAVLTLGAPPAAAAAAPITLTLDPGNGAPAGDGHGGEIELLSYSFGAALPATRVNKVDSWTIKQKVGRDPAGVDLGSWAKADGLDAAPASRHKPRGSNQMTMDDTAGAEKSGQATGKRQHMPLRTRSYSGGRGGAADDPYVLTGVSHSARLTVEGELPGCRVGRRYPSATLRDGARIHRLRDLTVSQCAGQSVTFTYTVTNPAP